MLVEQLTLPPAVRLCVCYGNDIAGGEAELFGQRCRVVVQRFDWSDDTHRKRESAHHSHCTGLWAGALRGTRMHSQAPALPRLRLQALQGNHQARWPAVQPVPEARAGNSLPSRPVSQSLARLKQCPVACLHGCLLGWATPHDARQGMPVHSCSSLGRTPVMALAPALA